MGGWEKERFREKKPNFLVDLVQDIVKSNSLFKESKK